MDALSTVALAWLLIATGCARTPSVRLLDVNGVGPARIESGELLRVSGSGFPSGRSARVRLDGVVTRPAETSRPVALVLDARAVSPERIEARAGHALFAQLGGGGTFRGRVEVEFSAAVPGAEPVSGASDEVVVLFVAPTVTRLSTELLHARDAHELLAFLGARPAYEADTDGVRLEHVDGNGRAAAAGLHAGDVIVESEGAIVASLGDLAPPRAARVLRVRVKRAGESAPLALTLTLRGLGGAPDPEWSWAAAFVALFWLLALLRFAPTARLVGSAQRQLAAAARLVTTRGDLLGALLAALFAAALAAVPRLPSAIDAVSVFGALFALRLVAAARGSRADRRARIGRALTLELSAGGALAAILVDAGTTRLAQLAAAQSLAPLALGALAGPVPLVAALLWLRVACVAEPLAASAVAEPRVARAVAAARTSIDAEFVRRALAVALLALVAFGGASSTPAGAPHALGATIVAACALLLSLATSRLRALGPVSLPRVAAVGGAVALASLALVLAPPSAAIETMASRACVALVFGAVFVAGITLWRRPASGPLRVVELS